MARADQPFLPQGQGYFVVGAPGRAPVQLAASCGSRPKLPRRDQPDRCILNRSSLPPGHNPSISER